MEQTSSNGLCRCCLAEGCFKLLSLEYRWLGEREVYADMLQECFAFAVMEGEVHNRLICEVCITRLRDAFNFKKQVLASDYRLRSGLRRATDCTRIDVDAETDLVADANKKVDVEVKLESQEDDDSVGAAAADDIDDLEMPIKFEETKLEFLDEEEEPLIILSRAKKAKKRRSEPSLERTKDRAPPPRKKAKTDVHVGKNEKKVKSTASPKSSKPAKKSERPSTSKEPEKKGKRRVIIAAEDTYKKTTISATRRNRLMKKNAIVVLESSTVCPFKWHRQNYLCFFCHRAFKDPELLKRHTKQEHPNSSIKGAVTYLRRDELVKIDVTDIGCRLCDQSIPDLTSLKSHLKGTHGKIFIEGYRDGLVPYKLQSNYFQCAICSEEFQYFIKLNQHMNKHFGNYICELCGKRFLSQDRLRSHALSHGGSFRCNHCAEIFDSLTQRTHHESLIHKKDKTLKCFYCGESFPNYAQRKKHLRTSHNVDIPEFKCPFCAKVFHIMSKMTVHVKEVHMREKNFSCNVCEQKFFSKNHVQKHMVKHFGERVHQCEVCKKSYARKQTLRDHMRIHNNDRRFVCAVCSQAFVQNNSLKLHVRVHHPDVISA